MNHQFLRGDEVGILWVFGTQIRLAAFQDKSFERACAVQERRDDLTAARIGAVFQHDHIAVDNVPANHRIARDAQRERVPSRLEADALHIHRHATIRLLFAALRRACRNGAEQRNVHDAAPQLRQR